MENTEVINKKKFFTRIALLVLFICILNLIILKFHWYYSIWWSDMLMHFLGGLWLGLMFLWLFKPKIINFPEILKIIVAAFLISIFWEIFEIVLNNATLKEPFNTLDTFSDLCFDLSGAFFSVLYFSKRIMIKDDFNI